MINKMCNIPVAGLILKPMMAIFDLAGQVDQIDKAIKSGDTVEIAVRIVQLVCMLFALTSQCFTGDTLVSTADGLRPIEEIAAGDYVRSENTETGEIELKEVLSVSVMEIDILIHVFIEDETNTNTEINTTENHPFYVEGKGWCAASELQRGDTLHTQDGRTETVSDVETEQLEEAVRVYNLEIEDSHTYYVSADGVLVHNTCNVESSIDNDPKLVKAAEKMGENQRVQQEANELVNQFINGNKNPGIGNKNLFGNVNYLREKNGARVFFRNILDGIEILAKADKSNENSVIKLLIELYGKG